MKVQNRLVVFGASVSLLLIVAVSAWLVPAYRTPVFASDEQEGGAPVNPLEGQEAAVDEGAAGGYWVCVSGEYVVVCDGNDRETVLETTRIVVRSLRFEDQELLRNGVGISGREELLHFLEDFGP